MLDNALESVAKQTGVKHISEVVVIENLQNRKSEEICKKYKSLNIIYIFNEITIPPGYELTIQGLNHSKEEIVAYLFDDDWWNPDHIERALNSFETCNEIIATFGSVLFTTGPHGQGYWLNSPYSFTQYFAYLGKFINNKMLFTLEDTLVASLLRTTFHLSTLVVKKAKLTEAIESIKDGNPYDTDRLLSVELAKMGNIAVDLELSAFIRIHGKNDAIKIYNSGKAQFWWNRTTDKILKTASDRGINLQEIFAKRLKQKRSSIIQLFSEADSHGSVKYLIRKKIIEDDGTEILDTSLPIWNSESNINTKNKIHTHHDIYAFCFICFVKIIAKRVAKETGCLITNIKNEFTWWHKNWRKRTTAQCPHIKGK